MTSSAEQIRGYNGPALFERGYRPFFLGAGLWAAVALPLWLSMLAFGIDVPSHLSAADWHIHEMLFGYVGAVIAGFLLTAVPNWTGRLPVIGMPLALLAGLWLLGRLAMFVSEIAPAVAAAIDVSFLAAVAVVLWREVLAGRNLRNVPACMLVTLLALANLGFQVSVLANLDRLVAERAALAVIAFLITLIGGRIVPSFTRNWLAQGGNKRLPAAFCNFDKAVLAIAALTFISWVLMPDSIVTAVLMIIVALSLSVRSARWRVWSTLTEPLVTILHIGYAWLPIWCGLVALHIIRPQAIDASTAAHALTAGAIGTMTIAVMTRATLGHSGRPLRAGILTSAVYLLVVAGAAMRVLAPLLPIAYVDVLAVSGFMWAGGFALFVVGYVPIFLGIGSARSG